MAARYLIPLALVAACTSKEPTDTDTPEPPPPEESAETGEDPPPPDDPFAPAAAFMSAAFVWDAATSSLVTAFNYYDDPVQTYIEIDFVSQEWIDASNVGQDPSLLGDDEWCYLVLTFPDGPAALSGHVAGEPSTYFAVDHSGLEADIDTNCDDKVHPMGDTFSVTNIMTATGDPWAVGLGALDDEAIAWLLKAGATKDDYDGFVGGRVFNSSFFFTPVLTDKGFYALPIVIDPVTFEAQVDGDYYVTMDPAEAWNGSALATGWYIISAAYGVLL